MGRSRGPSVLLLSTARISARAPGRSALVAKLHGRVRGGAIRSAYCHRCNEAHHAVGTKPRLAFALLLYSAQRRSDVVRMGRQHIKDGVLTVTQQKTGATLAIPVHPHL